jgi:N-acetyl-alpha-D-muramate 1-phosphate uridylyltransferase
MFPVAILAGGLATRLRPITQTIPKSLVEINGEPFLWHQLRLLRANGIRRVVLCVGYLGEMIRESVGNGSRFDLAIDYSFDGPSLLGTAGALRQALPHLDDSFFVLYGDSYLPCDWTMVQESFLRQGKAGLMTVCRNENRWDTSNVEFHNGQIIRYSKTLRTERMQYIDYGLGVLRKTAFQAREQVQDLAVLYQQLLAEEELSAFEVSERFYEIGSFTGIQQMEAYLSRV